MTDPLEIRLRYVVIDDIDFTPMSNITFAATLRRTQEVDDFLDKLKVAIPPLQAYHHGLFKVLKIIKPVPLETVDDENTSETSKPHGKEESLSLAPILRCIRDRTAETNKPELANEYVEIVPGYALFQDEFKHENSRLISAIVVLQLTLSESSSTASHTYPF
jgi:hypothetical protein